MSSLTKFLIVLQLVFALVCSVLLVLMVSRQENYKTAMDAANAKCFGLQALITTEQSKSADARTEATKARDDASAKSNDNVQLQAKFTQLQASFEAAQQDLKNQVASLEAKNRALASSQDTLTTSIKVKDEELAKLRPMIDDLNRKYGQSNQALSETSNLLRAAENTIKRLQEQLAQGGGAGAGSVAPLGSESQITTYGAAKAGAAQVNGKISAVQLAAGRILVELPLGTRDGLQVNTKMYVYRGTGYVADAHVQAVTPDQAIAVIDNTKTGETVQQGDLITTLGK